MSRTGRFGRQPRAVPSLGNTLVSIAREQERTIDSSITEAWQKGGSYRGQKVTDEMVLAHWRSRLKDISPKDPLADVYRNVVLQYEYSIAESKMTVQYAQHRISEGQAAAFYTAWAKKVPKNSEFYRVLMRDAAQYINASRNRSRGNTERIKEQAYQSGQQATSRKYERSGAYLTEVITNMAHDKGILDKNANMSKLDLSDAAVMQDIIASINSTPVASPNGETRPNASTSRILYVDPRTGLPVTAGDVKGKLAEYDPHFTGTVTLGYYGDALRQQGVGQAQRSAAADKTGHVGDVTRIANEQYNTVALSQISHAWPIEEAYAATEDQFNAVYGNGSASPSVVVAAYDRKTAALTALTQGTGAMAPDPALKAIIEAEISGNANIESLATQMGRAPAGDHAETTAYINAYRKQIEDVSTGKAVWTMGTLGTDGIFTAGKGSTLGAAPLAAVQALSPRGTITTFVSQGGGLADIPVIVAGKPIKVVVVDATGKGVPSTTANGETVGTSYELPGGTLYAFQKANGGMTFTRAVENLWAPGVTEERTGGGIVLHVTATPGPGNPAFAQSGTDANGQPEYSVIPAAVAFDPARTIGQGNPKYDSHSPTIAFRMGEPEGSRALQELAKNNPVFTDQLEYDAHVYGAGQRMALDPATNVAAWTGGDGPAGVASAMASAAVLTNLPDYAEHFNTNLLDNVVRGASGRMNTTPAFGAQYPLHGAEVTTSGGPTVPGGPAAVAAGQRFTPQLPSDALRGTAFDPLTKTWTPNSNVLAPPTGASSPIPSIRYGLGLTIPGFTPVTPSGPAAVAAGQHFTPSPTSITSSTQSYNTPYGVSDKPYDISQDYHPGVR